MCCRRNAPFFPAGFHPVLLLIALILTTVLHLSPSPSHAIIDGQVLASAPLPFANGERLSYDVTWLGMRAGLATMVVEGTSGEGGVSNSPWP